MKRDAIDFFYVKDGHIHIHMRLENWARHIKPGYRASWGLQPMFAHYRCDGGYETHGTRIPIDTLDASSMEKAVSFLPPKHRDAIRWQYVYAEQGMKPHQARKWIGVTTRDLCDLIHDGRSMLKNRA